MSEFPPAPLKEDANHYGFDTPDNIVRTSFEGGYVGTRPRTTRADRREWTTGFTSISNADKIIFHNFWKQKKGGAYNFTWTDPTTSEEVTVRFKGKPTYKYVGMGSAFLWTITVTLEEV